MKKEKREKKKTAPNNSSFQLTDWIPSNEHWFSLLFFSYIFFDTWVRATWILFYIGTIYMKYVLRYTHWNIANAIHTIPLISVLYYLCKLIRKVWSVSSIPCNCVQCMKWNVPLYFVLRIYARMGNNNRRASTHTHTVPILNCTQWVANHLESLILIAVKTLLVHIWAAYT